LENNLTTGQKWWLAGLGTSVALALAARFKKSPVEYRPHVPNALGIVEADPAGLARAAGAPLDVYALASAMQSEEKTDRARLAVGRAVWNAVRGDRRKLVGKLLPRGYFASQDEGQYAATSRGPTARTLGLAAAVVEGRVPDFVERAVQWDAPAAQDRNHQKYLVDPVRFHQYRYTSAEIAERRTKAGAHEVRVPGVSDTRFWAYS
jgi:hypothetical protein